MANNELFHRVAREALAEDATIQELVDDLDAAIESYLTERDEEGELRRLHMREEITNGYNHAMALADNLREWRNAAATAGG